MKLLFQTFGWRRHSNALQGQEELVEVYPPMNTARFNPAVVCTSDGDYLIVVGGTDSDGWTATVELFEVKGRRWYTLTDLPEPVRPPSAVIIGDQLITLQDMMTKATPAPTNQ